MKRDHKSITVSVIPVIEDTINSRMELRPTFLFLKQQVCRHQTEGMKLTLAASGPGTAITALTLDGTDRQTDSCFTLTAVDADSVQKTTSECQ